MGHIVSVPCSQPPQSPTYVGAYAVSDTRIMVVWDKPLGDGYKYKVTVNKTSQNPQIKTGEQGFGNAGLEQFFGLTPKTNYTLSVQFECKDNPGKFSPAATTDVKTLDSGKS